MPPKDLFTVGLRIGRRAPYAYQVEKSRIRLDRLEAKREPFLEGLRQLERQVQQKRLRIVTSSDAFAKDLAKVGQAWAIKEGADGSTETLNKALESKLATAINPGEC